MIDPLTLAALVIGLVAAGLDIAIALAGRRRRQRRQA